MGLKPLEFAACYLDSPYFRDNVYEHEKELERTNEKIKGLMKECKNLMRAVDNLSKAQQSFCKVLNDFTLNYIGEVDTPDEIEIAESFNYFASLIERVEEERERMLHHAHSQLIEPLEKFRKGQIGGAKEQKRKYDEETKKLCALQDKHYQLKNKTKEELLKESDQQVVNEFNTFQKLAFDYLSKLQEVNERKKFELVEILLTYMYGQKNFYHNGYECYKDSTQYLADLTYKLQTLRERYNVTSEEAEDLKKKTEKQGQAGELQRGDSSRQGYLYVQEKKHGGLMSGWTKHYCTYQKENKILTMIPYTQTMGKMNTVTDTLVVVSCERKPTEPPERRFCFEITGLERKDTISLQAMSDEDRRNWLDIMGGKEPIYLESANLHGDADMLTDISITFIKKCIAAIEKNSLEEEGLYRVAGVSSKFTNLIKQALELKKAPSLDLESDQSEYDLRTITSALKQCFRNLADPILTYRLYNDFLEAIKFDTNDKKVQALRDCISKLPDVNYSTLKLLMHHLKRVAEHSAKNLMQASNLGVVWGPTLMRPRDATVAALMNLKFQGVVIQTLISEYDNIFADDSGRVPKVETPRSETPTTQSNNPNPLLSRSPNVQKRVFNGPIGISNPSYLESKPLMAAKPPPSQKSYPAPPPPSTKPMLPKKKVGKPEEDTFEDWSIISEKSSGYSSSSDPSEDVHSSTSSPAISGNARGASAVKQPMSPPYRRAKPEPPPKRIAESVQGFTSVQKPSVLQDRLSQYENTEPIGVKRSVSFEKAMESGKELEAQHLPPIAEKNPSPPPIPRRKEWKVRALYQCVAENNAELSFGQGAIITNVRKSAEEGWLTGTLNGRTGLIPSNYVETIEES